MKCSYNGNVILKRRVANSETRGSKDIGRDGNEEEE